MPQMLGEGVRRAEEKGEGAIAWVCGDAEKLPLPDAHFDAYTIAFGIRNVTHIDAALREARRVLKPGGRFLCLEFSKVEVPGLDALYDAYSFKLLPKIGGWVAGDAESYRYLAESIRRFPPQAKFAQMIAEAGLDQVKVRNLSGGIAAMHSAWRICNECVCPASFRLLARRPRAGGRRWAFARARHDAGARLAQALERLGRPISSWARCWRRGPILSARIWRAALEHLQDRLPPFPEAAARAGDRTGIRQAGGSAVLRLWRAGGGGFHRPGASRHHQRQPPARGGEGSASRHRGYNFARDLRRWPFSPAAAEHFSAEARRLRLIALVETLAASVALELDLRMEAAAASRTL